MAFKNEKIEKWRGFIPDVELDAYAKAGFGQRIGFGKRPALLNIDTTYTFVDPHYDLCGAEMPEMIAALTRLTELFRSLDLPIYYSRRDDRSHPTYRGIWNEKLGVADDYKYTLDPRADEWPDAYAPRPQDRIIKKNKPSCFFQTPLESFLRYDDIDTLVVCGISTSGCVRGGATDGFSHNFRVILVEEACGDRSPTAHKASLFDLDMKFADVESLEYVTAEMQKRYGS